MDAAESNVTKGEETSASSSVAPGATKGSSSAGRSPNSHMITSPPSVAEAYQIEHSALGRSQFASYSSSNPGRPLFIGSRDVKQRALPDDMDGVNERNLRQDGGKRSGQTEAVDLGESNAAEREVRTIQHAAFEHRSPRLVLR